MKPEDFINEEQEYTIEGHEICDTCGHRYKCKHGKRKVDDDYELFCEPLKCPQCEKIDPVLRKYIEAVVEKQIYDALEAREDDGWS